MMWRFGLIKLYSFFNKVYSNNGTFLLVFSLRNPISYLEVNEGISISFWRSKKNAHVLTVLFAITATYENSSDRNYTTLSVYNNHEVWISLLQGFYLWLYSAASLLKLCIAFIMLHNTWKTLGVPTNKCKAFYRLLIRV